MTRKPSTANRGRGRPREDRLTVPGHGRDESQQSGSWLGADRLLATNPAGLKDQYVNNGEPLSWSDAVDVFRFEHGAEDRFGERWASGLWRRWLDRDRALAQRTETTLMVTLTSSPWLHGKRPLPPAHHLSAIQHGRETVLSALDDCLDVEHKLGWALGAHRNNYAHAHLGIWCFDRTDPVTVEPALEAYFDAVPNARPDEHGAGAVTAYHGDELLAERTATDERDPATQLSTYLASNVPGSGSKPERGMGVENELAAGDGHRVRLATVLDATGTDAYRRPQQ